MAKSEDFIDLDEDQIQWCNDLGKQIYDVAQQRGLEDHLQDPEGDGLETNRLGERTRLAAAIACQAKPIVVVGGQEAGGCR